MGPAPLWRMLVARDLAETTCRSLPLTLGCWQRRARKLVVCEWVSLWGPKPAGTWPCPSWQWAWGDKQIATQALVLSLCLASGGPQSMALNVMRTGFRDCTPLACLLIHLLLHSFILQIERLLCARHAGGSLPVVTPPGRDPPAVMTAAGTM